MLEGVIADDIPGCIPRRGDGGDHDADDDGLMIGEEVVDVVDVVDVFRQGERERKM